jgi:hypothetical protein
MDESQAPIYWVGQDFSSFTNRYNLFYLTEGTDVTFKLGQYRYEIYESLESIEVDENTTEEGLNKVEEGRMVVEGVSNSIYD